MKENSRIYIAGHNGMVGSAIHRELVKRGHSNIVVKSSKELDLRNQSAVNDFFESDNIEYVFLSAAKVGGIVANNTYKADFLYDNLMIQSNVIHAAHNHSIKKLLFLGSSCIYPKLADQPLKEEYLLTGLLEETNDAYAIAKIAGLKMCKSYKEQYGDNFISAMPTNLYGPNDNYDLNNSHVLPALIRKFHEAKEQNADSVTMWGTGKPRREFLHVDDLASACLFLMDNYEGNDHLNIGTGEDISILELAQLVKEIVGFEGEIVNDLSKPDGTFRKLMDVSKMDKLGWSYSIQFKDGIKSTYSNFLEKYTK